MRKKKSLTDSILLSKGVPQLNKKLMPWRRNIYILLTIEIITSIVYFSLEIFFTIIEDAQNDFFIWLILAVVFDVLIELYEWSILYNVEQLKLRCSLRLYYLVLFNILAASLTQSIDQIMNSDPIIGANLYFEILSFVCGIFIFLIGIIRIIIYHTIILKLDLKGKEKFIQKVINSKRSGKSKNILEVELNKDELDSASSFESFSYKVDKKNPFKFPHP